MKTAISIAINRELIAKFVSIVDHIPLRRSNNKIIIINKLISRVIGRININDFNFTKVILTEKLKHFKVITFDIQVFSIIEVDTFFSARAERHICWRICHPNCFLFIGPGELISFCCPFYEIGRE